jgi:UDP-N-acetylmuramate: L-alanyl-gamma-D-glutamyl-meso-diaminopimelate ligase
VATLGKNTSAKVKLLSLDAPAPGKGDLWTITVQTADGQNRTVKTHLAGPHNAANICQVLACLDLIQAAGDAPRVDFTKIAAAIQNFSGVKRRLDRLASVRDIDVFEDFAHHPTAVKAVLESMRTLYPGRRLIVAFEPKNATSRRNVFVKEFAKSLSVADRVFIGACPVDQRIPADQRMNTSEMAELIGERAQAFGDNEALLESLVALAKPNDAIIFMSSSSFSGIQYRLGERLSHPNA